MLTWLREMWRARVRRLDVEILWPSFKRQALDIDHARIGFFYHCSHDPAWAVLGEDEIKRRIDALE